MSRSSRPGASGAAFPGFGLITGEFFFDVHVAEVRTMSVKSKPKRRGTSRGRTRTWKKAIVEVRPGESIPIFGQGLGVAE